MIWHVVEIEVQRQTKIGDPTHELAIKVGTMARFREVPYTLNREIVIDPERAESICPRSQNKQKAFDVCRQRFGVVKPTGKVP